MSVNQLIISLLEKDMGMDILTVREQNKQNKENDKKSLNVGDELIITILSESDMTPICPQLRKTNKNSILNFARVGDAIYFYYYDRLCKTEP